jgi:GDP-4-dehydro-6-deoxy-D-mannose reductase
MRILITGITGFVGSHFADLALARGAEVVGSFRWRSNTQNIEHLRGHVELVDCDLRDASSTQHLIERARPDRVIHLAAQSFVGTSWQAPAETFMTNTLPQVNLLEAVHTQAPGARFLVIGSS